MQATDFLNDLCITELKCVQTYTVPKNRYPLKNEGRYRCGFIYTVSGTETYHFRNSNVRAVPGSILFIPKGEVYEITLEDAESVVTAVDFEILGEAPEPFLVKFSERSSVKLCFSKAESAWNRKDFSCISTCKSLCYQIAELLVRQQRLYASAQQYEKIADGVEYLHSHCFDVDFRIQNAADTAHMSCRYFEKLFSQKFGTTPNEYILLCKIERAKELLLCEKILIREIPLMLGYKDIYHFGKLFSAKTGYTPGEYRKKCRAEGLLDAQSRHD